jgi:hypothetical protein
MSETSATLAVEPLSGVCHPTHTASKTMAIFCGVLLLGTLYIPERLRIDEHQFYCDIFVASDPSSKPSVPQAVLREYWMHYGGLEESGGSDTGQRRMVWQMLSRRHSPGDRAMLIGCWVIGALAIASGITLRGMLLASVCLGLALTSIALQVTTIRYDLAGSTVTWGGLLPVFALSQGVGLATAAALAACAIWHRTNKAKWAFRVLVIAGLLLLVAASIRLYARVVELLSVSPPTPNWSGGRAPNARSKKK